MKRLSRRLTCLAFVLGMLALAGQALAAPRPGNFLRDNPVPRVQPVYLLFNTICGGLQPRTSHDVRVRHGPLRDAAIEYQVDIHVAPHGDVCLAVPTPRQFLIDLGTVPAPADRIDVVHRIWRLRDGMDDLLLGEFISSAAVVDTPDTSVSGVWLSEVPGEVTMLTLDDALRAAPGRAILTTHLFDENGTAQSLTVTGAFRGFEFSGDARFAARPNPAASAVEVRSAGMLRVTQLGCGRAVLKLESTLPRLPSTERVLTQISQPNGIPPCHPYNRIITPDVVEPGAAP